MTSTSKPPKHLTWLTKINANLVTSDGKLVDLYELRHTKDELTLSLWAKHFREHYCLDSEIDSKRSGTGLSRKDYLTRIKFPSDSEAPGPSVRAGDFAEILVMDFIEFILKYQVPRARYDRKFARNESSKGTDIYGFRYLGQNESPQDALISMEVKAKFTGSKKNRLQDAIDDAAKDEIRKAESLNAIKERLLDRDLTQMASIVERFQDKTDRPYQETRGAAAVFCDTTYNPGLIVQTNCKKHPAGQTMKLIVIKGSEMMDLVRELYQRSADEA